MSSEPEYISDILDFNPRRTISKGAIAPFVDMASLPINARDITKITEKEFKGGGAKFRNGDTLLARITPCLENGKTAQVKGLPEEINAFGSTEFIVMVAKQKSDENFVYYLARHPEFRTFAIARMEGTSGRQRVPWQSLVCYPKAFPNKENREQIGQILKTIDDKIELNQQMNKTLEKMAQALFKCWFVDFEPTRAKMAGESPDSICQRLNLTPDILALFPDTLTESPLGHIPEGWGVKGFDEIAYLDTTSVKPFNEPNVLWKHYSIPAFDINKSPAHDLGSEIKSNKYKVKQHAVLVSKLNPATRRIWFIPSASKQAICSTEFMQFVPKSDEYCQTFLYSLVQTSYFQREILSRVTGSTGSRQRAMPKQVHKVPVILPPTSLAIVYSQICKGLPHKAASNIKQNQKLSNLRDTLLPKLLSGELSVDNLKTQGGTDER